MVSDKKLITNHGIQLSPLILTNYCSRRRTYLNATSLSQFQHGINHDYFYAFFLTQTPQRVHYPRLSILSNKNYFGNTLLYCLGSLFGADSLFAGILKPFIRHIKNPLLTIHTCTYYHFPGQVSRLFLFRLTVIFFLDLDVAVSRHSSARRNQFANDHVFF